MPSRKQRRRRLKERRHEYEYVYVDEEGHEVEVSEEEQPQASPRGKPTSGRRAATTTRAGRRIEPPSWSRVGKRALFIAPVMFLLINLMGKKLPVARRIYETVVLLAIFLPFSYFMDSLMYRSYLKRTGAAPPPSRRRGSNGAA
ncbi:MAG: hypothetical protein E6G22_04240 [Actinobacteria bacterium]|nr:MAG: hypothetical protein E6G22_04240 [Actinomycetota bacterium]